MRICITSSSSVTSPFYLDVAREYTQIIMDMNIHLICGGLSTSMMKVIYDLFCENEKQVTLYTLECYQDSNICPSTIIVDTTFDRTKKLYEDSDIICVYPGGTGGIAELFSFIEEARTKVSKPIIIINENHFFDIILEHIQKLIEEGFNNKNIMNYIDVVNTKDEFRKKVEEYYGKTNNGKISELL